MASFVYKKAKQQFLQGGINLISDDIRAMVVDQADYTPDDTHEFLSSVPSGARVGVSSSLTGKAASAVGAFTSDFKTIGAVTGDVSELVILYKHTGSDATARLIACYDAGTGLPVTPDGRDIKITPASGIWFTL